MTTGFPIATAGMRVGLLGGSFDPPHSGHVHITKEALKRFQLDRVWWLVSPGNPLKKTGPVALDRRMNACHDIMRHPRVDVTDIETRLGTQRTADTITRLQGRYSGVRFVWLMGADNLAGLHQWHDWEQIVERVPLGVLARPGDQLRAGGSVAAQVYARYRLSSRRAEALSYRTAPCWTLLSGPMVDVSSTEIRRRGDWKKTAIKGRG